MGASPRRKWHADETKQETIIIHCGSQMFMQRCWRHASAVECRVRGLRKAAWGAGSSAVPHQLLVKGGAVTDIQWWAGSKPHFDGRRFALDRLQL